MSFQRSPFQPDAFQVTAANSRWRSIANQTEADKQSVILALFADLEIPGDRLRLHDGIGTVTWGGHDWVGLGQFGGVDAVTENFDVIAQPLKLSLSGVDSQYVTDAMTTQYHGEPVTIYVGFINQSTGAVIDTPEELWSGFMDVMTIELNKGLAEINITCEHRLRRTPSVSRYTDEDQRVAYSGDVFFDKLHLIPGFRGKWGARDVGGVNQVGHGGGPRREQIIHQ